MDPAPFFSDIDDGPEGAHAAWLKTPDGLRLRVGIWPVEQARGTVLLFPGRTEYVEKYGRAAQDLAGRGYQTLAIDWRGQGLSDRVAGDPALGHVAQFADYQIDVQTLLAALPDLGITGPCYLLAHSMGGAIGLRALYENLPVQAAAFTAPMWDIELHPLLRPIAWAISSASTSFGLPEALSPGTRSDTYVLYEDFADNKLTTNAEMYDYMRRQARAHPELMIGGPTMKWLFEALRETRDLAQMSAPPVPALAILGTGESIISSERVVKRITAWSGARLEWVKGARHEVMMEGPAIRAFTFDQCAALFDSHPA
ncbi:alpha/beta fold hydrolase [Pseudooceanicola algae]|uniref:Lysophospholipase L2 n=1 Tax=Pseudooceanicola algae TaxID=1537215 RepID=A0A418SCD3_9RHOB|nr:alpha/beta hydrolase [Pseudooceanicola algae]QPM90056.1 Lysophospholipase L2 [Pseudooceanicola algae]